MKIAACYIVKDEGDELRRSLESVVSSVDEIVVADTGSQDNTVEVAQAFGARILSYPWRNHFGDARNFVLEQVESQWIIFLDADESFLHPEKVRTAIEDYLNKEPHADAMMLLRYNVDGKYEESTDLALRVLRNAPDLRYKGSIHEHLQKAHGARALELVFTDERLAISHTGYSASRKKDKALRNLVLLEKEVEANGGVSNPFLDGHLADSYYIIGDYRRALECVLRAIDSDVRFIGAQGSKYHIALESMRRLGMPPEDMLPLVRLAVRELPELPEFYGEQGIILSAMGRLEEAKVFLKKAISIHETHPVNYRESSYFSKNALAIVYQRLGEIAHLQGEEEQAEAYFQKALSIAPKNVSVTETYERFRKEREEKRIFISACYIVRNEAENLARSLESIKGEADEILVADTGSEDDTVSVAKRYGARVLSFPWIGDFSAARNFVLEHARGEWILFLDADEYFAEKTSGKLRELLKKCTDADQLLLFWRNIDADTGEVLLDSYAPRIFRNGPEFRYEGRIHEELRQGGEIIQRACTVPKESFILMHTGYSQSVNRGKAERNLALLLEELKTAKHPELLYMYLTEAYEGVGDDENAIKYAEKDIATGRKSVIYASRSYRVLLRILAKRPKEIERRTQAAARAVRDFPEIPEFHAEYAECLAQHGRFREAVTELDLAEQCLNQPGGLEPMLFPDEMRPMLEERRRFFQSCLDGEAQLNKDRSLRPSQSSPVRKFGRGNGKVLVSACVITKDEEENLPLWLESAGEIADELVVVDTGSNDGTVGLAKAAGARVEHFRWVNDFSAAKNYAISKTKGDWILFLDADEYFPKEQRSMVRDAIERYRMHPRVTELVFLRVNIEKETGRDQGTSMYVTRCFRNRDWLRYEGKIHENLTDISGRGRQVKQYVEGVVIYHTGYSDAVVRDKLRRNLFFLQEKERLGEKEALDDYYFADCHYGLGEYEKASEYAQKTIQEGIEPVGLEERPYSILVQSLMLLKRSREEIVAAFENATKRFPLDARFYMLWGIFDRENGADDEAEKHFLRGWELYQRAQRENPFKASQAAIFLPTACFSLGEYAAGKGMVREAADYLIEGLKLSNRNAPALRLLCHLLEGAPLEETASLLEVLYDKDRDGDFLSETLGGTGLWETMSKK